MGHALLQFVGGIILFEIRHVFIFVEFWGIPPLIPLLQCVNRLGFEICSVNSCQTEQGRQNSNQKEPCLTPTLMDERQVKKPSYNLKWVYNGILEVYLDMEAHISSATQITQKEPKETTKRKGNILNHNGPEVNLQLNT